MLDSMTESQIMLADSYASDANIRNFMIFRDDTYRAYSERDIEVFMEKNPYVENIYLTDINGNVILTKSDVLRNRNMSEIRPSLWKKTIFRRGICFGKHKRISCNW